MSHSLLSERKDAIQNIPFSSEIYFNPELNCTEKMLLCEIINIYKQHGSCYATNEHFAEFLGVKVSRVQQIIRKLEEENYLYREIEYKDNSKEIKSRYIIPCEDKCGKIEILHEEYEHTPCKKLHEGGVKNYTDKSTLYEEDINGLNRVSFSFKNDSTSLLVKRFKEMSLEERYNELGRWYDEVLPKVVNKKVDEINRSFHKNYDNDFKELVVESVKYYVKTRTKINKNPMIVSNNELQIVISSLMTLWNEIEDLKPDDMEIMIDYFYESKLGNYGTNNPYAATMFFNGNMLLSIGGLMYQDTNMIMDGMNNRGRTERMRYVKTR